MIRRAPGSTLASAAVALLVTGCLSGASAQVSTNTGALDTLGPAHHAPASHAASRATSRSASPRDTTRASGHGARTTHGAASGHAAAAHAGPSHAAALTGGGHARIPPPTMHPRPPPIPIIAPPTVHVDLHPPPPPPPVTADPKAPGSATTVADPADAKMLRVTFGAGSAALNPATLAAIHAESARLKADPDDVVTIDAFAPGTPDDPSSPRRLSLARALVARAVMINDGVPSTRIYARALGTLGIGGGTGGSGADAPPPDRIDIAVSPLGRERPMPVDPSTASGTGTAPGTVPGAATSASDAAPAAAAPTSPSAPAATATGAPQAP